MANGLLASIGRGLKLGGGVLNPDIFAQQQQEEAQAKARAEQRRLAIGELIMKAAQEGAIPSDVAAAALKSAVPELADQIPPGILGPSQATQDAAAQREASKLRARAEASEVERLGMTPGLRLSDAAKLYELQNPSKKADNTLVTLSVPGRGDVSLRRGDPRVDELLAGGATVSRRPPIAINMPPGETAFKRKSGQNLADMQFKFVETGDRAASSLPIFSQLSDLLSRGTQTGAVTSLTLPLREIATDLGVDVNKIGEALGVNAGEITSQQDFNRLAARVVIDSFEQFKGNLNPQEVKIALDAAANLGKTPEANASAIAAGMAAAQIAAEDGARAAAAQSGDEVRTVAVERARRGVDRFKMLKGQFEQQILSSRPAPQPQQPQAPTIKKFEQGDLIRYPDGSAEFRPNR